MHEQFWHFCYMLKSKVPLHPTHPHPHTHSHTHTHKHTQKKDSSILTDVTKHLMVNQGFQGCQVSSNISPPCQEFDLTKGPLGICHAIVSPKAFFCYFPVKVCGKCLCWAFTAFSQSHSLSCPSKLLTRQVILLWWFISQWHKILTN